MGVVKNSEEACAFCTLVIGSASPPSWVRCKIHKLPSEFLTTSIPNQKPWILLIFAKIKSSKLKVQRSLPKLPSLTFRPTEGRTLMIFINPCKVNVNQKENESKTQAGEPARGARSAPTPVGCFTRCVFAFVFVLIYVQLELTHEGN